MIIGTEKIKRKKVYLSNILTSLNFGCLCHLRSDEKLVKKVKIININDKIYLCASIFFGYFMENSIYLLSQFQYLVCKAFMIY